MRVVTAAEIGRVLDYQGLIAAIRVGFAGSTTAPVRHHHTFPRDGAADATIILMPAWHDGGGFIGVKIVTIFPDNGRKQKPSVMGSYLLLAGDTGEPLAILDGRELTLARTAATSALVAEALARPDAQRLAMVGTGALAPRLIAAHAAVRPIREVSVWGRDLEKATALAQSLDLPGIRVTATADREAAVGGADIVSVATLSHTPLVAGAWLRPGTHLDLVGAFLPTMREADDDAVRRATVYVDTRAAMRESGDIAGPLQSGVLSEAAVAGDLFDLARRPSLWRSSDDEITLFKSVGHAIEDLAAAAYVWGRL